MSDCQGCADREAKLAEEKKQVLSITELATEIQADKNAAEAKLREVGAALDVDENECTPTLHQRVRAVIRPLTTTASEPCRGIDVVRMVDTKHGQVARVVIEHCKCCPTTTASKEGQP